MRIVVAGGGAAGFFGAIACAESLADAEVILLEKSPELLAKVTISGGGRCNVTHACFDPAKLVTFYPRGSRELLGAFHRWQPRDTVTWFESRGAKLKTEDDGRMFPVTNKSTTITDCLIRSAKEAGVDIRVRTGLVSASRLEGRTGFLINLSNHKQIECDRLLLATGGNQNSASFAIAESLGHTIEPLVPSLFTFHVEDPILKGLEGLSVPDGEVRVTGTKLVQRGPVLITHWGLSGPAILKLSAWGARVLHDANYDFTLNVNWLGGYQHDRVQGELVKTKQGNSRHVISAHPLFGLPRRLWERLTAAAGIGADTQWASISNAAIQSLRDHLVACTFHVRGKSMFKEEFVTCGGVRLKEVDFRTMESKKCPGLHFAGEVLDIDGVTGGFNLQAAWTTGWIAGKSMGQ